MARMTFSKILIANRGEIACRIIKTCKRLNIRTVAVYSTADANARHVRLADEAICIGPAASRDSYLRAEQILAAAVSSGAEAIHPGYGFLSENAAFAQACAQAGVVFIGPPVNAIHAMGSKSAAKTLMQSAAVPLVPGYHGEAQDAAQLRSEANVIGYPVLIKASAGGGGKGMRIVQNEAEFESALASCQREARASFGDARVLVEKYLQRPRHIEIQVFGDQHGHIIALHERDCSAQRRHQKVVEEAPAPGMSSAQRAAMSRAACDAARAVGYVGAGTIEFIVAPTGEFYFMEMNTRLQVEHPVTEMITGQDLVEWQLRIAAGEPLPLQQDQVPLHGHAIEVRVYAEDPAKGFLPSIGRLIHYRPPNESNLVRVDGGVEQGDDVTPHYDPMLAKLIVWGETRSQAIAGMLQALAEYEIVGVGNNLGFLQRLINHQDFRAGKVDTNLIERDAEQLLQAPVAPLPDNVLIAAVLSTLVRDARNSNHTAMQLTSPWDATDGWRLNSDLLRTLTFRHGSITLVSPVRYAAAGYLINDHEVVIHSSAGDALCFYVDQQRQQARVVDNGDQRHVFMNGTHHVLTVVDPLAHAGEQQQDHGGLTAPMSGAIIALPVMIGSDVKKGAPLVVMEAMKMEHTLCAPSDGRVRSYLCKVGEQVRDGTQLVDFEEVA